MGTEKRVLLDDIERLRGFACILVLLMHLGCVCRMNAIIDFIHPCFLIGNSAVSIFFVISGFVVVNSIRGDLSRFDGKPFLEKIISSSEFMMRFFKRRFLRIFPVLLFVFICIGIFFSCAFEDMNWFRVYIRSLIEIVLGTFNYDVETYIPTDPIYYKGLGPLWTLAVEAQFYLLWPVILLMCKNDSCRALLSLSLGCVFLFVIQPSLHAIIGYKYYFHYNYLHDLFLGSFLAYIYRSNSAEEEQPDPSINAYRLILMVLCVYLWIYKYLLLKDDFFMQISVSTLAFFIVAIAAFKKDVMNIPFLGKFLYIIGKRSYSIYAIQLCVGSATMYFTNSIYFSKESMGESEYAICQFIIFIISLGVLSEFSYRFIETPFRKKRS